MAYDTRLAVRVREQLADNPAVHEQAMFGGLAVLVAGRLAVAASGQGGLPVRVDPANDDRLLAGGTAQRMQMNGRAVRVSGLAVACTVVAGLGYAAAVVGMFALPGRRFQPPFSALAEHARATSCVQMQRLP